MQLPEPGVLFVRLSNFKLNGLGELLLLRLLNGERKGLLEPFFSVEILGDAFGVEGSSFRTRNFCNILKQTLNNPLCQQNKDRQFDIIIHAQSFRAESQQNFIKNNNKLAFLARSPCVANNCDLKACNQLICKV